MIYTIAPRGILIAREKKVAGGLLLSQFSHFGRFLMTQRMTDFYGETYAQS
jgi:hypothetical protein